jgi:cation:H+ antiporter
MLTCALLLVRVTTAPTVEPASLLVGTVQPRVPTTVAILLALLAGVPAVLLRTDQLDLSVELATACFGVGIVGAAFAISWAAEAAEHDIPRALSLTVVALLAVLPEYAVDIVFAYKAAQDPTFAPYAAANMTGSNRLLIGLGWSTVAFVAWFARRGARPSVGDPQPPPTPSAVPLDRDATLALLFVGLATAYSFSLPLRSSIAPLDSLVLIGLFAVFVVLAARREAEEPELVGPAAAIGALPSAPRRLVVVALFAFAGGIIAISAEPFADGLVHTGQRLGIDEFLLVQWLAPLASECPEFLVAVLLAARGKAAAALSLLLSAKLNQWTLLVGSLPLAYSVGAGHLGALPLDERQVAEVLLTAAQSLFGVAVLIDLSFSIREAALLAVLFSAQLILGGVLRAGVQSTEAASLELFAFSAVYLIISAWRLIRSRRLLATLLRPRWVKAGAAR